MRIPELKTEEEAKVFAGSIWNGANNNKTIDECIAQANKALEEYREIVRVVCPYCNSKETRFFSDEHEHQIECCDCGAVGPIKPTKQQAAEAWAPKPKLKGPLSVERLSLICGCSNGVKAIVHDEQGEEVEIKDKDKIWIEEKGE